MFYRPYEDIDEYLSDICHFNDLLNYKIDISPDNIYINDKMCVINVDNTVINVNIPDILISKTEKYRYKFDMMFINKQHIGILCGSTPIRLCYCAEYSSEYVGIELIHSDEYYIDNMKIMNSDTLDEYIGSPVISSIEFDCDCGTCLTKSYVIGVYIEDGVFVTIADIEKIE
jgi:hypothetical protein